MERELSARYKILLWLDLVTSRNDDWIPAGVISI